MAFIFSMPRPSLGYEPGQIVTDDFAATHPGMVSEVPTSKALSMPPQPDPEEDDPDELPGT